MNLDMEMKDKMLKTLDEIVEDTKNDATEFDGRLFDGHTVAEYFGNQGAAIAAMANIMKLILDNICIKHHGRLPYEP